MDSPAERPRAGNRPDTDLVEYLMILVPQFGSLDLVLPALAELVASASIRILDLVCLATSATGGSVTVIGLDQIEGIATLDLGANVGELFSEHDIETASQVLAGGSTAILLMVEDRWAENLSAAARQAGGRVAGGGRIAHQRIEAALRATFDEANAAVADSTVTRRQTSPSRSTGEHLDLLSVPQVGPSLQDQPAFLLIDPAAQMTALADLVDRGLVSPEEFERQRKKVFGP